MSISKRAQQFQGILDERGLGLTVLELPDSTRTADDAARTLGCTKAQIVKSLVFRDTVTDRPVLVLASGPNRVDEVRIGALLGAPVVKADGDYVKRTTGFAIGGVPPLNLLPKPGEGIRSQVRRRRQPGFEHFAGMPDRQPDPGQ